jgi:hypothetical protein
MGTANTTALRNLFPQQVVYGFGDVSWPPRSPDLTAPNIFFSRDNIKVKHMAVGQQNYADELKARIREGTPKF